MRDQAIDKKAIANLSKQLENTIRDMVLPKMRTAEGEKAASNLIINLRADVYIFGLAGKIIGGWS